MGFCKWTRTIILNKPLSLRFSEDERVECPKCRDGYVLLRQNQNGPFNAGDFFLSCSTHFVDGCNWTHPLRFGLPIIIDYEAFMVVDDQGEVGYLVNTERSPRQRVETVRPQTSITTEQADEGGPSVHFSSSLKILRYDQNGLEHNFLCHEGAGITKRSRFMRTLTATCSCGLWKKTAGSRGSLKASWDEHVDDATPF